MKQQRIVYDEVSRLPSRGTCCTAEEGRTRQEDARGCDINVLMTRGVESIVPQLRDGGVFADVSNIKDLHSALEDVRRANMAFGALPADVRSAFENEPAKFVDAFQTPEGMAKLRELKVVPETEETLAERREAAAEARAIRRREERELAARVEAAKVPPGAAAK